MSEHMSSFIMLAALAMYLTSVIVLRAMGLTEESTTRTLLDAALAMGSGIVGYSMPRSKPPTTPPTA